MESLPSRIIYIMPTYSYRCNKCKKDFELFFYIKDYQNSPKCAFCQTSGAHRLFIEDAITLNNSVKKSDTELKTIGDLAKRNSDRMSEDQKISLYNKHNSYKEQKIVDRPLPKGMSYMKKPPKTQWTKGD
jgi:putative FmdB family regulatory protein